MSRFDSVTRHHVHLALKEYDALGGEAFRDRYGFGSSRDYVLVHEGRPYDSKAILGVALKHATGVPGSAAEFSGGKDGAAKILEGLGFEVTSPAPRNASTVGTEEARAAWAGAAREALLGTAKRYRAVITYKELAAHVQHETGIRTRMLMHYWIGDVLGRVSRECAARGEPLLSSLCVNAEGSVGPGYAGAVEDVTGEKPADPDDHAAIERHRCHQYFEAADLPSDGGTPALTRQLSAARDGDRRNRHAEKPVNIGPTCQMAVPATGRCDNCD
jgi:hypothetical protein